MNVTFLSDQSTLVLISVSPGTARSLWIGRYKGAMAASMDCVHRTKIYLPQLPGIC